MMKYLKWILALALIIGAIMSAPDKGATKLAVLGKFAEVAGEQSGAGIMGQANAAFAINLCMMVAPNAQPGKPSSDHPFARKCQIIQRMQDQTRVIDFLVFNVALLNMEGVPRIVCLGAVESVKCFASGGIVDMKREAVTEPKTTPDPFSPAARIEREEGNRRAMQDYEQKRRNAYSTADDIVRRAQRGGK